MEGDGQVKGGQSPNSDVTPDTPDTGRGSSFCVTGEKKSNVGPMRKINDIISKRRESLKGSEQWIVLMSTRSWITEQLLTQMR